MTESESVASSIPGKAWSETRRGRIAILAGMLGLFVLVFWTAMKSRGMLVATPTLVVEEQYLSFGEVWEDPAFVWSLPIRNTTNQDITIGGFATSCSCAKIEPESLMIPGGQTKKVRLTLDLTPKKPENLESTMREFAVHIIPYHSVQTRIDGWTVRGRVRAALRISPRAIDFGRELVRGKPFPPKTVKIECCVPLKKISTEGSSPYMMAKLSFVADDKMSYKLEIKIRDSIVAGPFEYETKLRVDGSMMNMNIPAIKIPIRGIVEEDIHSTPVSVMFGIVPIGERIEETILLQSHSGDDFNVEAIKADSEDIIVSPVKTYEIGIKTFRVSQRAVAEGHHASKLMFVIRSERGARQLKITVPVSYHGIHLAKEKDT
jgi:hypothetical protein